MRYRLGKDCLAASLSLAFCLSIFFHSNTSATGTDVTFTVNNTSTVLELSVPSSVDLRLTPTRGSAFNTANLNIGVGTNNSTGYSLSMTATSTDLTRTASITDGNNNTSTPTIPTISTAYSPASFESSNDTINKWGFKLSTASNYGPMVTTTQTLKTTEGPSNATGSDVILNFAAKVDTTQPAGIYQTTLNFTAVTNALPPTTFNDAYSAANKTKLNNYYRMQDMNSSICSSVTNGQTTQLIDARDNKVYHASKLDDGNCWMTQNLDFDIINGGSNLDHTNTDVPSNWSDAGNLTNTYATGTTTWNYSTSAPESYDPGDLCWNGVLGDYNLSNGTTDCNASNKHYHIGNYYNWTAAVAMSDSSSYTVDGTDVDQSICPAGWRLPTYDGDKSYDDLVSTLNLTSGTSGNIQNSPVYFVYGGYWYGSSSYVGLLGSFWSSVVYAGGSSYELYFNSYGSLNPQDHGHRGYGYSIRCVAR